MLMKKSLAEYLDEYDAGHTQLGTKLTHLVGIPLIVASLPTIPFNPVLGLGMFGAGWALQLIGHYVFENNSPKLIGDPFFAIVGVIWVAVEIGRMLGFEFPVIQAERQPDADSTDAPSSATTH